MTWLSIFTGVAAGLAALGFGQIVLALLKRRVDTTDMAVKLNASTLEFATELKKTAADAMAEAHEARDQMRHVRSEAEKLADYLAWIVRTIQDPHMDIDRLRVLVGNYGPPTRPDAVNGR